MSGLCGWLMPPGHGPASQQITQAMGAALTRFDLAELFSASGPHGGVAVAARAPRDASLFKDVPYLVALWGHASISNHSLALLAKEHGIAHAIAEGYRDQGKDVVRTLSGAFAVALLDARRGEAFLATDRLGTHPIFYSSASDRLIFGSTLAAIAVFPGQERRTNLQAIYDYVHFHMVPGPQTIFSGVHRLEPGSLLWWRTGRASVQTYWRIEYVEDERRPFSELKHDFLAEIRAAVRGAIVGNTGAFLSGGTDSSTVAGLLGEATAEPARTFSIGFSADDYDETRYARIAAQHFGTRHHEYYVTPADVVGAIPSIAAVHDQPFGNASAVPTYYCAKLAKEHGIHTLLGGDGGDELFGGNSRYALQYVYSLYGDLSPSLRERFIEPMVFALPTLGIIGKAQRYMRSAVKPMPARYDNFNLLERLGTDNVFTADFLSQVDVQAAKRQFECSYREAHANSPVNRMLALDLKYTLADNDLPKVMRSCELAGVNARFPMLADGLVAFSARLAPELKVKRTQLRYFFKKALRGYLPDAILKKTKHGFGLPFGRWLAVHKALAEIALDSVTDLKRRNIVRPEFIEELTSRHVRLHADYFGTMVWVLMMLEQWFNRTAASAKRSKVDCEPYAAR